MTDKEKRVLMDIGNYFLSLELETKEYDEALNSTYRLLNTLNITDIRTIGVLKYEITMCRPGLFIGSRGSIIDGICKSLGIKIDIKENIAAGLVYPLDITQYSRGQY